LQHARASLEGMNESAAIELAGGPLLGLALAMLAMAMMAFA